MRRLVLVTVGLLAGLLAVELLLRAGAAVVSGRAAGPQVGASQRTRVLCVGDSNTWGWGVAREETYPARLAAARLDLEVINAGFPGTNSTRLRRDFPRLLDAYQPAVVVLLVGVNDFWTAPGESSGWSDTAWRISRVYRLGYMLTRSVRLRFGAAAYDLDWWGVTPNTTSDWPARLRDNVAAMHRLAEERGVRLVVLTYPQPGDIYQAVNAELRAAAATLPLVELTGVGETFQPDGHPTAATYAAMAERVSGAGLL